ncbi:MAG: TolC family protein [Deltaproteobacteria bacterium]|nr:TolC family protein [Deltaproteobacteria bacterium]
MQRNPGQAGAKSPCAMSDGARHLQLWRLTNRPLGRRVHTLALLLIVSLMLAPSPRTSAQGQDVGAGSLVDLTLDDAIGLALQNNRSLLNAQLARAIQVFTLEVAEDRYSLTASFSPVVHAQREASETADIDVETGLRIETGGQFTLRWSKPVAGYEDSSGTVSLGFSQPLLRGFGADIDTASLRMARLSERIGALSFREAVTSVVVSTIQAWRGLVRARRQLEIGEASMERARRQLETNRALIEAGQMAAREILQSEADVAERELGLVETRNGVVSANFGLINILDIDSATEVRPVETTAGRRQVLSLAEAIETALGQSPRYARALLDKEIADINLDVAENDRLWDLSLTADVSRGTGGGGQTTDYSAGLRLTVPLWDRGPELGLRSARAGVTTAERGLAELRQAMDIEVRQAMHNVDVGLRKIELARQTLALAEEKIVIERSKLEQGLSSTYQLIQFEEDLVRAQNAEVDAVFDYENALTALDRTLGTTLETWGIAVEQIGQ